MRLLIAFLALAVGVWLQASPWNNLLPVRLDPLLIMVAAWGTGTGSREGAVFGLAAGLVQELVTGGGLALVVPKILVGAVAGSFKPLLYYRQAFIILPLIAGLSAMQETVVMLGFALSGRGLLLRHLGAIAGPEAVGNVLIAWPIYAILRYALKRTRDRLGARAESLGT